MTTLTIPKPMHTDLLFDQEDDELFEREVRNPVNETPVKVKTEPIDEIEFGMNDMPTRKELSELPSHSFKWNENMNKDVRKVFIQGKQSAEVKRGNEWDNLTGNPWKQAESTTRYIGTTKIIGTTRSTEDRVSSSNQEELSREPVTDNVDKTKQDGNENGWKRTVVVGKPKKHSNKQRKMVREYVDVVLTQIRREAEEKHKKLDVKKKVPTIPNDDSRVVKALKPDLCLKAKAEKKQERSRESKKEYDSVSNTDEKSETDEELTKRNDKNANDNRRFRISHPKKPVLKYLCSFCPMKYALEISLKRHMFRHTKVKPFPCFHCSQGYFRIKELDQHMDMQHPGLPY